KWKGKRKNSQKCNTWPTPLFHLLTAHGLGKLPLRTMGHDVYSALRRCRTPQQPGGTAYEDQNQNRENEDIGPTHRNELSAQRFDQSDENTTKHRARNI